VSYRVVVSIAVHNAPIHNSRLSVFWDILLLYPMKILITAPSLDENENVSGISSIVRQIVRRSDSEFFHFHAGRRDGEKSGLKWAWRQFRLTPDFKSAIKRFDPDVVHINTSLVKRAIARDVLLAGAARKMGKPVLLHVHGGPFAAGEFEWWHLGKSLLNQANQIIVLSELEKEAILERVPDLDIEVLPNAVPVDEIPNVEKPPGVRSILYFGRLDTNKGLHTIVEACRALNDEGLEFDFNCYGAGPDAKEFIDNMLDALDARFYYGGVVTGDEKWRVLAENDIFLLPSRYEGLPMALLEAMAAGCVPVVSDVGSVSTVVEDGVNGYLVEPGNAGQVADRLSTLLTGDIGEMSGASRISVKKDFDIRSYVRKLDAIYRELAANG
jgi:glycosyltransferase involved in cell wall biosynthesis